MPLLQKGLIFVVSKAAPVYNSNVCDKLMANPKKIVIKINRSSDRKNDESKNSVPSEIVIWNVRRIVLALIIALLFVVIPYFILDDESKVKNNNNQEYSEISSIEDKPTTPEKAISSNSVINRQDYAIQLDMKPADVTVKAFNTIKHYKIKRGLLTNGVFDKEPIDELVPPFKVGENASLKLFYFTEIRDMKGQSLFHQWIKDGVVIQKTTINPQGKRWRVSSNRELTRADIGRWIVQLLDQEGLIYHEVVFELESE